MISGLSVFFGILVLLVYTIFLGLIFTSIGEATGNKAADKEAVRRVLISDKLDDEVKVEILSILTDKIYWKYYEELDELQGDDK